MPHSSISYSSLTFIISLALLSSFPSSSATECRVSDWSAWSSCYGDCQYGQEVRNRDVSEPPLPEGLDTESPLVRLCPHLYETRFCTPSHCLPKAFPTLGGRQVGNLSPQDGEAKGPQRVDDSTEVARTTPNSREEGPRTRSSVISHDDQRVVPQDDLNAQHSKLFGELNGKVKKPIEDGPEEGFRNSLTIDIATVDTTQTPVKTTSREEEEVSSTSTEREAVADDSNNLPTDRSAEATTESTSDSLTKTDTTSTEASNATTAEEDSSSTTGSSEGEVSSTSGTSTEQTSGTESLERHSSTTTTSSEAPEENVLPELPERNPSDVPLSDEDREAEEALLRHKEAMKELLRAMHASTQRPLPPRDPSVGIPDQIKQASTLPSTTSSGEESPNNNEPVSTSTASRLSSTTEDNTIPPLPPKPSLMEVPEPNAELDYPEKVPIETTSTSSHGLPSTTGPHPTLVSLTEPSELPTSEEISPSTSITDSSSTLSNGTSGEHPEDAEEEEYIVTPDSTSEPTSSSRVEASSPGSVPPGFEEAEVVTTAETTSQPSASTPPPSRPTPTPWQPSTLGPLWWTSTRNIPRASIRTTYYYHYVTEPPRKEPPGPEEKAHANDITDSLYKPGSAEVIHTIRRVPLKQLEKQDCSENPRCCKIERTACPDGANLTTVTRYYRPPGSPQCLAYNYPRCSLQLEADEQPIAFVVNCYDLCFPLPEKNIPPLFRIE